MLTLLAYLNTASKLFDANFNSVALLTKAIDTGAFVDSSSNASALTKTGSPIISAQTPFSNTWSTYFNGSSYLSVASSAPLNLSGYSWTIEAWINPSSYANYNDIVAKRTSNIGSAYQLYLIQSTGYLAFYNGTPYTSSTVVPLGVWSHVAATYNGTTLTLYFNGLNVYSSAVTITDNSAAVAIGYGNYSSSTEYFNGYISNVRIIKGTILYGSNFVPSAVPLAPTYDTVLLTCQSENFIDDSTNNFAITVNGTPAISQFSPFGTGVLDTVTPTSYSTVFNGTTDNLITPTNSALALPNNVSWTVEFWYFQPTRSATVQIAFLSSGANNYWSSAHDCDFNIQSTGYLEFEYSVGTTTATDLNGTTVVPVGQWNHIAYVYNGSAKTMTTYINGIVDINAASVSAYNPPSSSPRWTIGRNRPGGKHTNLLY